jgi:hypothetical protein
MPNVRMVFQNESGKSIALMSTTSFFLVVKMPGAHIPGAHMPGADMTGAYIPGAHMPGARTVHPLDNYSLSRFPHRILLTDLQV